ncbi:MAG: hypothetical protein IJO33_01000 [Bacilli bacterium]|nr:hypothetical protein [Bacilli bacterium]
MLFLCLTSDRYFSSIIKEEILKSVFSDLIILGEGVAEEEIFKLFVKKYPELYYENIINTIVTFGKDLIPWYCEIFNDIGIKTLALYDLDYDKNYQNKHIAINNMIEEKSSLTIKVYDYNNIQKNDIEDLLNAGNKDKTKHLIALIREMWLKNNPKFVGDFSDPTGLLYPITTKYDIATIYGQNFSSFGVEELHRSQKDFLEIVKGNLISENSYDLYEMVYPERVTGLEGYNLTEKVYWKTLNNQPLHLKGRIIGGCFDLISEIAGTKYDGINEFNEKYKNDGIIWYFDNCEISIEETIRTLWKMGELGYFKYTKGVIFGRFGVEQSYYGYNIKTCLEDSILNKLDIPVIYDADISHKAPCLTIINGAIATIDVEDGKGTISFELE